MLRLFTSLLSVIRSNIVLVPISAVKRFIKTPHPSVTANPFMGPVPNWKRTTAVISVVTCESNIVQKALS